MILERIDTPADLRSLSTDELVQLAAEIRGFIVASVTRTGGHLGSNLGAVEITLALHRIFDSPHDVILWDTGHQAYVHKLVTGRREEFARLRQAGGLSGYPSRAESAHDWIENSHASTALSYAHGLANAFEVQGSDRRVVAVVGDGALTGGMAYEALNNLGHSGRRVLIVLNDNGRSYAPTVSHLSLSLTHLRLHPAYLSARQRFANVLRGLPGVGPVAYSGVHGLTSGLREVVTPHTFFEALGIRYAGPIDGHNIAEVEQALTNAREWDGPIVLHMLTQKGRGYAPAEEDVQRLHDVKVTPERAAHPHTVSATSASAIDTVRPADGTHPVHGTPTADGTAADPDRPAGVGPTAAPVGTGQDGIAAQDAGSHGRSAVIPATTYTDAFTRSLLRAAEADPRIVAITAAMPGPTGLLAFQDRFPERFVDVGIAEQHAVTAAAGMAMGGLRPVVAVYSTFFSRAFDQANLDVGLHGAPVVFVLDRAGITGDDGPSHHGVLDLVLSLSIPGMTVFAPSNAHEVEVMLADALALNGPSLIRFPKTPAPSVGPTAVGAGLQARRMREGDGSVCILAVGKPVAAAAEAVDLLGADGIDATLWDVRVVTPPDRAMLEDAARHQVVITVEDGLRQGGAGMFLADALDGVAAVGDTTGTVPPRVPRVRVLGVPTRYIPQDKPDRILARFGLDGPGIARSAREALGVVSLGSPLVRPGADSPV